MTMREFVARLMGQAQEIPITYTLEDAEADMTNFRADGWELPEDATAQALYDAMQDWMAEYVRINADA